MRLLTFLSLAAAFALVVPGDLVSQGRAGRAGMSSIGNTSFGGGSLRGGGSRAGGLARGRGAGAGPRRGGSAGAAQPFNRPDGPNHRRSGVTSTGFRGTDRVITNPPRAREAGGGGSAPVNRNHVKAPRVRGWTYDAFSRSGHRGGRFGGGYYGRYNPYFHYGLPFVYAPYGYTRYRRGYDYGEAYFDDEDDRERRESGQVYRVDPGTATESSSQYVIRVPATPQEPVTGTVFEVRPEGLRPASPETAGISPEAGPARQATFHLIALRDGTIHTSREHWLEQDALHYVTRDGVRNRVTVGEVDLDLTAQVNRERGLPFVLEVREPTP